jgi:poly(A) polymerase/tRNA nucleotidyltransferase (CCA-adding enzyme)
MAIPNEVKFVITELKKAGFEAYIVGGCVRDLLRGVEPLDWDITTIAKPEQIGKIFLRSFADNKFGTVKVQIKARNTKLMEIEITPFRIESKYTDKRHPDQVKWAKTLKQDLCRRDFTINAMAALPETSNLKIIDLFDGRKDLENKIIRAVGEPNDRFNEDALRLIRATRFATTLGENWKIDSKTKKAIQKNAGLLQMISKERIRDEFMKIIMSDRPKQGIELLRELELLRYIIPELEEGYGVEQNKHHIYNVYEHSLLSLKYAAQKNFNKYVRLAALFHDIGKPRVKSGQGQDATFYNHEIVGAKMCRNILTRLRFPNKDIEKITKLVRYHLFYYHPDEVGESSVRRLVRQVGIENTEELLQLRMADRIGSGVPKAEPYKLRHLKYVMEKVSQDPISVKMLKINGNDVMKILGIGPSLRIGQILDILLGHILGNPEDNNKKFLEQKIKNISQKCGIEKTKDRTQKKQERTLTQKNMTCLEKMAEQAQKKRDSLVMKQDQMTKKKYWVT